MTAHARRLRANALLLVAAAIWGFAFTAQRVASGRVGAYSFSSVRFALGALVVLGVLLVLDRVRHTPAAQRRAATRAVAGPGALAGALLAVAVNFQQVALVDTTASNAAFITGLYLVMVPLIGIAFGRRPHWTIAVAVALAVAGLYLIAVSDAFTLHRGDALVLVAALAFAVHILVVDRVGPALDPLRFAAAQFTGCAVFSGLLALWREDAPFAHLGGALVPLAYGGLISVGIAYTLQVVAQRDALPAPAALLMSLESVFGAVGGLWLLHETLTGRQWLGAAFMLAGTLLAVGCQPAPRGAAEAAVPVSAPS